MPIVHDYAPLRSYLNTLVSLDEQEWEKLHAMLTIKHFEKKQLFQDSGKQCKTVGFLLKGCFRWVRNIDGVERTFDFALENDFVTDYLSIMTQSPSGVDIIAVEDSDMACVDAPKLLELFDSSFAWQKIGRKLAEGTACYAMQRLVEAYYEKPRTRYQRIMTNSPELFLRVPHHMLANYLGMTKETLSRLRNTTR
jgi:CRP-like cAMP-binding protein